MEEPKKPSHVRGNRIACSKFIQCPLCYGCRAYSSHDLDCLQCVEENKKKNICNKDLHKDKVVANFITKTTIKVDKPLSFISANKE